MSAGNVQIRLNINFPSIFIAVLIMHALFLGVKGFPELKDIIARAQQRSANAPQPIPLNLKEIRTVGSPLSKIKNSNYLSKSDRPADTISPVKVGQVPSPTRSDLNRPAPAPQQGAKKQPLSFKDLAAQTAAAPTPAAAPKTQRPGARPEVTEEKKAISAISLKGKQIREFMQESSTVATSAAQLSGDPRARSLNNSDILVNLEVPEGVNPDELNQYELMFYGFQRRTAINYVNAFYNKLDKFQRENPHLQFPLTEGKQVMTGRLTYDEKGNIKQIKMIRWTNVDRLQNFFEDVLKDMDTLHNPPKPLWSKTGEFSIFFSLVING